MKGLGKTDRPPSRGKKVLLLFPGLCDKYGIGRYARLFVKALGSEENPERALLRVLSLVRYRACEGVERLVEQHWFADTDYPARRIAKLRFLREAWRQGAYFNPDVVVCGHLSLLPAAWLAAWKGQSRMYCALYGREAWKAPSPWLRPFLQRVGRFIAISQFTKEAAAQVLGFGMEECGVVPCVIDPTEDRCLERRAAREQMGWSEQGVILLSVASLARGKEYKGQFRVLECLPELLELHPDVRYVITGEGGLQEDLVRRAHELGVEQAVIFTGYVDDQTLDLVYAASDVFVLPSGAYQDGGFQGEGFGFGYLEAAARGLPVIGGRPGGAEEVVCHGKTGYLVDVSGKRCPDLLRCLKVLVSDSEERKRLGTAGKEYVEKKLNFKCFQDLLVSEVWSEPARRARGL